MRPFYRFGRQCLWALTFSASCILSAAAPAADWPQWLGPARNGNSTETILPWTTDPEVVWRHPLGSGFSSPLVVSGIVYANAAVGDEDAEEVLALDALTGRQIWRDSYPRAKYRSDLGTGPRGTPCVVDGRLYSLGVTGVLGCYDARSGQRHWQINVYEELHAPLPGFGVCTSPIVAQGRVILPVGGSGNAIVAVDIQTGKIAWKALDEPAGSASPVLIERGEGANRRTEVVVQTTLRLVGVDPADGTLRWEHPLVFQPSGVSPTPLVSGDVLICSTQDDGTLALKLPDQPSTQPHLEWWNQDIASYFSTGTLDPAGSVFIVTNALMPLPRADLRCMDVAAGKQRWEKRGLGYFHLGLIRLADGKLLSLNDNGDLLLSEPTDKELKELCKAKVCGGTFCNPALANGRVYVRDRKELICVSLQDAPVP